MKDVFEKLVPEYEWLPVMIALDLLRIHDKPKSKRQAKLNEYMSFVVYFYEGIEDKVVECLTKFVEMDLILEIKADVCRVNEEDKREIVDTYICNKQNLKYLSLLGVDDFSLAFISPVEIKSLEAKGWWIDYKIKVDVNALCDWLDFKLKLFQSDEVLRGSYKYSKQKQLFDDYLKRLLDDFVPIGLKVFQFKPHELMILPLLIYERYKDGSLVLQELRVVGNEKKILFVVDVLNDVGFSSNFDSHFIFDSDRSVLIVSDFEIKIKNPSQQYRLLKLIFTEPARNWEFAEILEQIDNEYDSENWKKWYDVAYNLKNKIDRATQGKFKDLIVLNTYSIKINSFNKD